MASGIDKPLLQAEQMPANGQPANDQLKSLAKGAPSTDARVSDTRNYTEQYFFRGSTDVNPTGLGTKPITISIDVKYLTRPVTFH